MVVTATKTREELSCVLCFTTMLEALLLLPYVALPLHVVKTFKRQ